MFEVKSTHNMLDQHSNPFYWDVLPGDISSLGHAYPLPCTPSQVLISSASFSTFPDCLSLLYLPTYQVTFLLLPPYPALPPLSYTFIGPHPSLPPLALGWLWCTLLAVCLLLPGDKRVSAEFKNSGFYQFQTLMKSIEPNAMDFLSN